MHLEQVKWGLALAVFVAGMIGGQLALKSARFAALAKRLGHANAFASGIVLGIGLLHMLPHAHEVLHKTYPEYPVAFLFAGAAFFILLLVEHVLLAQGGHHHGARAPHGQYEFADEVAVHAGDHRLSSYVLMAGLSIHSILAGIALGAQTDIERTLAIFVALVCHKSTEGFALGVSLARNHVARSLSSPLLVAFACATPAGIALGAIASRVLEGDVALAFEAIFSAVAGGTFLYIASLDMIGEEFSHGDQPVAKWLAAAFGLTLAALLAGH